MRLSEVIEQRLVNAPAAGGDVTDEAVRRGWLLPFTQGQYVYGPEWTSLLRRLQGLLLARASGLGRVPKSTQSHSLIAATCTVAS